MHWQDCLNLPLAGELRAPIRTERIGLIILFPGPRASAIEDVIRRDVNQWNTMVYRLECEVADAGLIDRERQIALALGAIDGLIGGCGDDDVGLNCSKCNC